MNNRKMHARTIHNYTALHHFHASPGKVGPFGAAADDWLVR
jgi:hypothetical protein